MKKTVCVLWIASCFIGSVSVVWAEEPVLKWIYEEYTDNGDFIDDFKMEDGTLIVGPDGTVYFGDEGALNSPGVLKLRYETNLPVHQAPAIGPDGTMYISSQNGFLYAFNPDGTVNWKHLCGYKRIREDDNKNYPASSPAVGADGTIYVGSKDSNLYALTPYGTLKWKFKARHFISKGSPAIGADGTIYFTCRGHRLYALAPDGTLKWEYETGDPGLSSPVIATDGTIYIGGDAQDNFMHALYPDGMVKWKYETENGINASAAIGSDGTIYFGCSDNYFYALNPDGTLKWRYDTGNSIKSSPAISPDGTIYFLSDQLYALQTDSYGYQEGAPWPCFMHNNTRCAAKELPVLPDLHTVSGTVALPDSTPLIEVEVSIGGLTKETDKYGRYFFLLPDDDYTLDIGVNSVVVPSQVDFVVDGSNVVVDLYDNADMHTLSGRLLLNGVPLGSIPVTVLTLSTVTDENGYYTFELSDGAYEIRFDVGESRFPDAYPVTVDGGDVAVDDFNIYEIQWVYETADELINPAVAPNGSIYVIEEHRRSSTVHAVSQYGEQQDMVSIGTGAEIFPPQFDKNETVYLTLRTRIAAKNYDLSTKWNYTPSGGAIAKPFAFGQNNVLYFGTQNTMYALNIDGSLRWKNVFGTDNYSCSAPAVASDGMIYFNATPEHRLTAMNSDGEIQWRYQFDTLHYADPVVGDDGIIYMGSYDGYCYAFNPNGSVKWRFFTDHATSEPAIIGPDGTIYFNPQHEDIYALNPDGTLKWIYSVYGRWKPYFFKGMEDIILNGQDGVFICLTTDGREKWRYSFNGSDQVFFAQGQENIVYAALSMVDDPGNSDRSGKLLKLRIGEESTVSVTTKDIIDDNSNPQPFITHAVNHPNPFNPSTSISFTLQRESHVTTDIYNISGQRIARLTDESCEPGMHSVKWNATGFPAGLYFYRIRADKATATGKMLLVK